MTSESQRLQLASVYKGEADKILQVKKAEAKYLGGVDVARQRQAITDGLREYLKFLPYSGRSFIQGRNGSHYDHTIL
ncbi:hypothetical protein CTI12_AA105130 [Artemisia annua]|uniref:Uncharacterized protein n=1 Tax=Artemisia annua TaxID=35608 RepID=A0A2U1PW77_ARTAN|nr:hypothetical protein CTI12_AA105130 [Artemisia annua]